MASFRSLRSDIFDREERKQQYQADIRGLNAYDRHKKFLNDYDAQRSFIIKGGKRRSNQKKESEKKTKERVYSRNQSRSDDETDVEYEGIEERRKGKKASISTGDRKIDDDDNFDEFLEGMFP